MNSKRRFWPERVAGILIQYSKECESGKSLIEEFFQTFLAQQKSVGTLDPDRVIERLKKYDDETICSALDRIERDLGIEQSVPEGDSEFLTWKQVEEMHRSGLVSIGSHTCQHRRFNEKFDESTMNHELRDSRDEIAKRLGQTPRLFCYPNGQYSASAISLVRRYFRAACTTDPGWVWPGDDAFTLRRVCLSEFASRAPHTFLARLI
jgi:hypothetical protein